ncbi:MAG: HlyC/CorC family transporter [Phycisphaerae bacterium]|nr:HlyC/CorC family transporter [Phycisphaerae bacterium]
MDEVGWSIVLLCISTAVSLFFALNTLALRSFARIKLQEAFRLAGREDRIEVFLQNAEQMMLACGVLRVAANAAIILLLANLLVERHILLTFLAALVILEIFTLAIPHAWSKHAGEHILARTYGILALLVRLLRPAIYLFDLHDRLVRRLAGVPVANPEQAQEDKQEEILNFVEQSRMEGVVDAEELEMIENVLELDETTAEEIMTPRTDLIAVSADADLQTVLNAIRSEGHSRLPVYEGTVDNIVGLVYAKDLLNEIGKDPTQFTLRDRMRAAYFVPESKPLRDLLHEFQKQTLHFAVVVDEYGGTAGVVTIEDILEELVGEIADEYETPASESFRKIDETTFDVDARMYIDDVNSELEIELPEDEDYDTLGGFVFSHLGCIPKTGESFVFNGLKFIVAAAGPRSIKRIRIRKLTPETKTG